MDVISTNLLKTLLPNYLKTSDTKVLSDVLETIVQVIKETDPYILDVSKIYSEPNEQIKIELTKTYLENIYYAFTSTLYNDIVARKVKAVLESLNINESSYSSPDLMSLLDSEYFMTSKEFKQKKGLKQSIQYAYNLMRRTGVQPTDVMPYTIDSSFSIKEGSENDPNKPFYITVTGSLYREIYESTVKEISHPLGFGYDYIRLLFLEFIEYVNYKITYPNAIVKVICNLGVTDYSDRGVFDILSYKDEIGNERIVVLFNDNTKLVKTFDDYIIEYDFEGNIVKQYPPVSCEIKLEYTPVLENIITDDVNFIHNSSVCDYAANYRYKHPLVGPYITVGHIDFIVDDPILRSIFLRIGSVYVDGFTLGNENPTCSSYAYDIYKQALEEGIIDEPYEEDFTIEMLYTQIGNIIINNFIIGK